MDDRGYLMIMEDETFVWVDDIDDDDIQSAYDGYCSIINLNDMCVFSPEDEDFYQMKLINRNFA